MKAESLWLAGKLPEAFEGDGSVTILRATPRVRRLVEVGFGVEEIRT